MRIMKINIALSLWGGESKSIAHFPFGYGKKITSLQSRRKREIGEDIKILKGSGRQLNGSEFNGFCALKLSKRMKYEVEKTAQTLW